MKPLEKLCEELGVEIGEVWLGDDGKYYYIDGRGHLIHRTKEGYTYTNWIERVLTGKLKPIWEPKEGEFYFTPNLQLSCEGQLFNKWKWQKNSPASKWHNKLGIIYRTKEKAIEISEKIMEFLKEERQNGEN